MILAQTIIRILFVGNSLTYVNDLPSIVTEIAALDGVQLQYKTIAYPDFSLDDHLGQKTIQLAFDKEHFDFLIAQQGPSTLSESQVILKQSAIKVSGQCKSRKAIFGLYMVWPERSRNFAFDDCILSYTNAAKASNALLCPAGVAWKYVLDKDPAFPLYGPDGFHPGIHGSVLAAMVIYATVNKKKDLDFITTSAWKEISDDQLVIMKRAAVMSLTFP